MSQVRRAAIPDELPCALDFALLGRLDFPKTAAHGEPFPAALSSFSSAYIRHGKGPLPPHLGGAQPSVLSLPSYRYDMRTAALPRAVSWIYPRCGVARHVPPQAGKRTPSGKRRALMLSTWPFSMPLPLLGVAGRQARPSRQLNEPVFRR